jgi:hypothetical protein
MPESWPGPIEVFEHYLRSREAFLHLKTTCLGFPDAIGTTSRFYSKTPEEIDEAFRQLATELDIQINLLLIASGEARLRVDFQDRVKRRRKDSISQRFRNLEKQRKANSRRGVRLEDILNVWAGESAGTPAGEMGKLLIYRHWIAHGRYWVEKKSGLRDPDPFDVWNIIRRFLNSLPGFDPLPIQTTR